MSIPTCTDRHEPDSNDGKECGPVKSGVTDVASGCRRRIAMRLVVSVTMVILACAVMEVILRFTWDRDLGLRTMRIDIRTTHVFDDEFRWLPKPNIQGIHPGSNTVFTTNSRGLRDREYAVPKPPGTKRVVVLGDSFTWGFGVGDKEIFTEILEQSVDGAEIVNLGVIGDDLRTEWNYLQREGMGYQPDVVIIALCQNDLGVQHDDPRDAKVSSLCRPRSIATAGVIDQRSFRSLKRFMLSHFYLYAVCIEGINSYKPLARAAVRLGLKEELGGFEMLDDNLHASLIDYPPQVELSVSQAKADLLRFDSFLRANGCELLVALIPSRQAADSHKLARFIAYTRYETSDFDLDKPYRIIERFASEHGITVCNPLEDFRKRRDRGEKFFFRHDMHFNPAGHRAFAEAIQPVLTTMLSH